MMESDSKTYAELKARAREVHKDIKERGLARNFWLACQPAEEHAIKLERGFYRNEPKYIEDGDYWINSGSSGDSDDFWDFLN